MIIIFLDRLTESNTKYVQPQVVQKSSIKSLQILTPPKQFTWNTITTDDVIKATKHMKNSDSNDVYLMSNNVLKRIIGNIEDR